MVLCRSSGALGETVSLYACIQMRPGIAVLRCAPKLILMNQITIFSLCQKVFTASPTPSIHFTY